MKKDTREVKDMTNVETGDILEIKIFEESLNNTDNKIIYHLISECINATSDGVNFNDLQTVVHHDGPEENPWSVTFNDFKNQELMEFYKVTKIGTKKENPEFYL